MLQYDFNTRAWDVSILTIDVQPQPVVIRQMSQVLGPCRFIVYTQNTANIQVLKICSVQFFYSSFAGNADSGTLQIVPTKNCFFFCCPFFPPVPFLHALFMFICYNKLKYILIHVPVLYGLDTGVDLFGKQLCICLTSLCRSTVFLIVLRMCIY